MLRLKSWLSLRDTRSWRDGLFAGLVVLLVSCLGLFYLQRAARSAQLEAVRSELAQLARAAAVQVNGDLHKRILSPTQAGSAEHLALLEPLVAFHKATSNLIYVYTVIQDGNQTRLVLGTDYLYHVPGDDMPPDPIMTPYTGTDVDMQRALTDHVVTVNPKPVHEPQRDYMSAYAPFYDHDGHFAGVLGIDMWVKDLQTRLVSIDRAAYGALIGVTVLSLFVGFGAGRLSRVVREKTARDQALVASLALAKADAEAQATRAEVAARAKSDFLATMSHEIRTPMNGVLGVVDLLLDTSLSDEQRLLASTAKQSADLLLAIIDDILDFSKIEAGKLQLAAVSFDLEAAIGNLGDLLAPRAKQKDLQFSLHYPTAVPTHFLGDATRIRQVLLNLLSNALKFTEHGHVFLRTKLERIDASLWKLRFEVEDSGIGIDASQQARLFSRFTQVDASTTRKFGGTGLGLAISRSLVEMMGGSIGVTSTPGAGSIFWCEILLPASSEGERANADLAGCRALVIDESQHDRDIVTEQLVSLGCIVEAVASSELVIEEARRKVMLAAPPFDVALLSASAPEAADLARLIRGGEFGTAPRLVWLGTRPKMSDQAESLVEAADGFISKPLRGDVLRATVFRIVSTQPRPHPKTDVQETSAVVATGLAVAKNPKVLLVDDNSINLMLASKMLHKIGCEVVAVDNGPEAIERATAEVYALILMDCDMPGMDGFEATARIRAAQVHLRTPIIALTANAMEGDRERCVAAGMDDYLSKPVNTERIHNMVTKWAVGA